MVLLLYYLVQYQPGKNRNRYDGEIIKQDRMNKSLRWKTLKKDVANDMKTREGERCEGKADVEALEGCKIRPMEECTSSPSSPLAAARKSLDHR